MPGDSGRGLLDSLECYVLKETVKLFFLVFLNSLSIADYFLMKKLWDSNTFVFSSILNAISRFPSF